MQRQPSGMHGPTHLSFVGCRHFRNRRPVRRIYIREFLFPGHETAVNVILN
jgi:hypothetical protein